MAKSTKMVPYKKPGTNWQRVRGILGSIGMAASTIASIIKMLRDTGMLSAALTGNGVRVTLPVYRKLQAAMTTSSSKAASGRRKKVKVYG